MNQYLPQKGFKVEIIGIIAILFLPVIWVIISLFLLLSIQTALVLNLFMVGVVSLVYFYFYYFVPYGKFTLADSDIILNKLGRKKSIRFDEVTEIHRVEMTPPFTYWGQYYFYVKSRDSKIKFSDRIENYEDLLKGILKKCGESSFNYSEDPMNKWWRR